MKKILIQLIGGQTLPNIFSLISVEPDRVVHLYTEKTKGRHDDIVHWCETHGEAFGLHPEFAAFAPISERLDIFKKEIADIIYNEFNSLNGEEAGMLILNMTGGTKLMSAMAMSVCMSLEARMKAQGVSLSIPIFYVNTQARDFDFLSHAELKDKVLAYDPFSRKLSARQIIESRREIRYLSGSRRWQEVHAAAALLEKMAPSLKPVDIKAGNIGELVLAPITQWVEPDSRKKMQAFVTEAGRNEAVISGLGVCGFVYRDGNFYAKEHLVNEARRLEKAKEKSKQGRKKLEKEVISNIHAAQNFFIGGWWEVLVAHAYQRAHPTDEVLWSVETASEQNKVETDIIATDGCSLCCVSCKRGMHKQVTQELEQHCTRTELLGGVITERIMAMYWPHDAAEMKSLAKVLNMKVWDKIAVAEMERTGQVPDRVGSTLHEKSTANATSPTPEQSVDTPNAISFLQRIKTAYLLLRTRLFPRA